MLVSGFEYVSGFALQTMSELNNSSGAVHRQHQSFTDSDPSDREMQGMEEKIEKKKRSMRVLEFESG
jgi:hypothetical protein